MHFFIIMVVRRISLRDIIVHVSAEERHHTCVAVGVISAGVEDRSLILVAGRSLPAYSDPPSSPYVISLAWCQHHARHLSRFADVTAIHLFKLDSVP